MSASTDVAPFDPDERGYNAPENPAWIVSFLPPCGIAVAVMLGKQKQKERLGNKDNPKRIEPLGGFALHYYFVFFRQILGNMFYNRLIVEVFDAFDLLN